MRLTIFMRSHRWFLALPLFLALSTLGCVGPSKDPSNLPSSGSRVGGGTVEATPDIEGIWTAATFIHEDDCGIDILALGGKVFFDLVQFDTVFDLEIRNSCGSLISDGAGTVNTSSMITILYEETAVLSETCVVRLVHRLFGTVNRNQDEMSGSEVISVFAQGDCSTGTSCEVRGGFLAEKCPPATCEFDNCSILP